MYFSGLVKESNIWGEEIIFQKKQKEQSENDLKDIFGSGLKTPRLRNADTVQRRLRTE